MMAWFALLFALLIDGLTLLFALVEGKNDGLLLARKNKDIIGKSEEALEEMLMTHLSILVKEAGETGRFEAIAKTLEDFLSNFKLLESEEAPYAMWAPLSQLEMYHAFVALLCQFNLATLHQEEGEALLYLKTKSVIWMNQKIANLRDAEHEQASKEIMMKKLKANQYYI